MTAIILAGGGGERLGGVLKANLMVGRMRLIERVVAAIGDFPVMLAHGLVAPERYGLAGRVRFAPDLPYDYAGPLAGVAGAVAALRGDPPQVLLSVAVDTPFLPDNFAEHMLAALPKEADVLVARHAGQDYPTNALWRWAAIADLPQQMSEGVAPHSLKTLAAACKALYLDWPAHEGGDPFANLNNVDDLIALNRRALRERR